MTIVLPKETGGDFEMAPTGTFSATCYRVIDLGTQQVEWQKTIKRKPKILISWELTDEKMLDGKPFSMHQRYTLSSSDKATLRKHLEAWRGVPFSDEDFGKFDIGNLIGKACLLGIMHTARNGKTYADLSSIMRMPKGMAASPLINEPIYFSLGDFRQDLFDKLSQGLQAVIAKSPEYQELKGASRFENHVPDDDHAAALQQLDEEIPF
jgi:hypothetical protein